MTTAALYRDAESTPQPSRRWEFCRHILALVLITTVGLKAYQLTTMPILPPGLFNQRWVLLAAIQLEALFAGLLLFTNGGVWLWVSIGLLWVCFLSVAACEAITGTSSCGCFGRLEINPWYTASFDLLVLITLPFCKPTPLNSARLSEAGRWIIIAIIALSTATFGAWNLNRYKSSRLSDDGLSFVDSTVILEPAKWVEHPFPLAGYIDIGSALEHGDWIVLIYRHDCEHCQRALANYRLLRQTTDARSPSVALIEIPPFALPHADSIPITDGLVAGKLSDKFDWFASTPVMVKLSAGRVKSVAEGEAAQLPPQIPPPLPHELPSRIPQQLPPQTSPGIRIDPAQS